eukprot:gb/GECH01001795.1/.p1 GENE.gb/GECH01001795.1/~~gb/GECH01001795.1/.p1  ORF type:complete len:700 (+),score=208.89 gb/GECH01001795.1/:1-2100(+)
MPLNFLKRIKQQKQETGDNSSSKFPNKNDSAPVPFHLRDPCSWSKDDVCLWLNGIGLSEYASTFFDNEISGEELLELEESDFTQLNITKWGHRKKLATKLKSLRSSSSQSRTSGSNSPRSSFSSSPSQSPRSRPQSADYFASSSFTFSNQFPNNTQRNSVGLSIDENVEGMANTSNEIVLKCIVDQDNIQMIMLSTEDTFEQLEDKIRSDILSEMDEDTRFAKLGIKFKDEEDDLVTIKNDNDLRAAIALHHPSKRYIKLWIQTIEGNSSTVSDSSQSSDSSYDLSKAFPSHLRSTARILDSLVEGAIMMDVDGIISYVNKATAKLFQYPRSELIGQHISVLMPESIGKHHDEYIERYLRTGNKNVIGTSRKVDGVRKNGENIPIWITVSDSMEGDDHIFIGTIHDARNSSSSPSSKLNSNINSNSSNNKNSINNNHHQERSSSNSETENNVQFYKVMDNLLEAALVTNQKGQIIYANKAVESILEFDKKEMFNRPLSLLFPAAYLEKDVTIQKFVQSGGQTFVGTCHDTVLQTKSQAVVPVTISVSDDNMKESNGSNHYVTIIRERQESVEMEKKTQLQQEREVIDNLALPGVIMDENRIIQGFNAAAAKALEYDRTEVLGRNVAMLIPEGEIKKNHDSYVKRYMETGKGKIIGTAGRELTARRKDGSLVVIWASVTERKLSESKRIFTAILHPKPSS